MRAREGWASVMSFVFAPLSLKKSFAQKIFGLNLTLHGREARGVAEKQWASIAEAHQKIGKTETCLLLVFLLYQARTYFQNK